MFGDLMGNMEEQQKALKEKLSAVQIQEKTEGATLEITSDGNGVIKQILIDDSLMDASRKEELEDLLIIHINNLVAKAKLQEMEASKMMLEQMMPSGLSGLSNLFGK